MIVVSVIITSSPNGSSGVALIGGGGGTLGVCAAAPDRPKPIIMAAATGSHKIREATIGISPAEPSPRGAAVGRIWAADDGQAIYLNTRSGERLAIKSLQPYKAEPYRQDRGM